MLEDVSSPRRLCHGRRKTPVSFGKTAFLRKSDWEGESAGKLLAAFLRKAEEGVIGKLIVEAVILLSASKQADGGKILRAASQAYKVDTDAIALKVKQGFAAKEKARSAATIEPKPVPKALKKIA